MILIEYTDAEIEKAMWVPLGGAICGHGADGILFDLKDFDSIVTGLTSDSRAEKARMIDYLCTLITRFNPGEQSHEAILPR